MRHIFATAAILALSAGPAHAQEIPAGQSCGGLFCDLGIFGHKTAPAAAPAASPAPPAVRAEAVPATEPAAAEPRRRIVHRKRAAPETKTAAAPAPAPTAPRVTPVATPVAAPVAPVVAKRPPPPPSNEPVIFVSPASQTPGAVLKDMFQPIYR